MRIANTVEGLLEKQTAWLHDVLEDCPEWTPARLRELGCPPKVLGALDVLTKRKGETYPQFISRIAESQNPIAITVKRADIEDNSDPRRLLYLPPEDQQRLARKYAEARRVLMEST